MRALCKIRYAGLLWLLMAGCANLAPPGGLGVDRQGAACVGTVMTPPAGLIEISDPDLVETARGAPGQGKLCMARAYLAQTPVTVYRVWDSSQPFTVYGKWWSFSPPAGDRDSYRKAEAICPEWSGLDRLSACSLKPGTHIVVGPGQSADCNNGLSYPPSAENQVYIPNDSRNQQIYLENCTPGAPWPE